MANYFCTDSVEEQVDYLTDKVKDLNTKKLDKAAVVQATGTGTDVVMSQKAVTDAIAAESSNYYTKTESDAKYSQATNLENGTGENSVQQKYIVDGVDYSANASGINSIALGGKRFDKLDDLNRTATSAEGNQSFAACYW